MRNESITLTTQEKKRAMVLNRIQAGYLSVREATEILGISPRHCRRILQAIERKGLHLSRISVHRILTQADVLPRVGARSRIIGDGANTKARSGCWCRSMPARMTG